MTWLAFGRNVAAERRRRRRDDAPRLRALGDVEHRAGELHGAQQFGQGVHGVWSTGSDRRVLVDRASPRPIAQATVARGRSGKTLAPRGKVPMSMVPAQCPPTATTWRSSTCRPPTAAPHSATTPVIDEQKLHELLGRAIVDFGGADIAPLVVIGDRLGLYRALAAHGPLTSAALASQTATAERYVREWLNAQAASGYVDLPRRDGPLLADARASDGVRRRGRPGLHRRRFPDRRSRPAGSSTSSPRRSAPARASAGTSTITACSTASSGSSARRYIGNLVQTWIPALDGDRGEAARRRARRRHRLRPRRLDDHHGAGVSDSRASSASTTTPSRSTAANARARKAGRRRPLPVRGRRAPRTFPAPATTS